jgi:hypothetical protein
MRFLSILILITSFILFYSLIPYTGYGGLDLSPTPEMPESTVPEPTEKVFNASKFGLIMKYPGNWALVPKDKEFTNKTFDYSYASAALADVCPSALNMDCQSNSDTYLEITAHKLKNGTTLDQFYEQELTRIKNGSLTPIEIMDKIKVKVSGLPAIESTIMTSGVMDKLLANLGQEPTNGRSVSVDVVNGNIGYHFFTVISDLDFESSVVKDMIDSVQLKYMMEIEHYDSEYDIN